VSKAAAAELLGLSVRRVLELSLSGAITRRQVTDPVTKRRRTVLLAADLDEFAKSRGRAPQSNTAPPVQHTLWLSLEEAAAYSGLPVNYLARQIRAGHLAAIDVGVPPDVCYRVARRDLDSITAPRPAEPPSTAPAAAPTTAPKRKPVQRAGSILLPPPVQGELPLPIESNLVTELRLAESNFKAGLTARNTVRGYAGDWKIFEDWCVRYRLTALPATEETVSLFLTDQLSGHKITTVRRRKWAIVFEHRARGLASPVAQKVRELLRGAQRLRGEKPRQMKPITVAQLREMSAGLCKVGTPLALRDRAMLVLGFASSLRRCNITALNLADVEFVSQGLILSIGREKQDQEGVGRLIGIPKGEHPDTDPVRVLEAWLRVRTGTADGPLFSRLDLTHEGEALDGQSVCRIVKECVLRVGINPAQYGAHSLRAGFVTAASEKNISALRISRFTAQSPEIVQHYFRRSELWRNNVCGKLGL
jgi:site-specific recombinase XerD